MAREPINYQSLLKDSVLKIQQMKTQLQAAENKQSEPLAIVGMACRYPSANTPEEYWKILCDKKDLMTEVPSSRWDIDAYYDPERGKNGKVNVKHGAFLDQVDQFDPAFFNISPREAIYMDPQNRLLLETSWEALERANIVPANLRDSRTGFFLALSSGDYGLLLEDLGIQDVYAGTGNANCFASGRMSYILGLQGPNMVVDTACSASLVAVHLAGQSLRAGECDLALVGAVNLMLHPKITIALSQMQALAPDGRCKAFDAAANGTNRGEGCVVIVMKRLSDALAASDNILAVIRGSAVNHGGASGGLTIPNKSAQEKLVRDALKNAQVSPDQVTYIEAHGTGTSLGDPIEAHALGDVFQTPERKNPLWLGSVKTNIGHLEPAAGIAGLMKVILAFQYNMIPPNLHFHHPNPHIDWANIPLRVPTEAIFWPAQRDDTEPKRIAGVSSFGMGGTNGHVILEEAPRRTNLAESKSNSQERDWHLLNLSAKNSSALNELVQKYRTLLDDPSLTNDDFGDICYTANLSRSHFDHRLSVVADSVEQMRGKLANEETHIINSVSSSTAVAFLFTGQGSQYNCMGQVLYETAPIFRETMDRCDELLQTSLGRSLIELLYPSTPPDHNDLMTSHACGQAVNFAIECALADLWRSWGVEPEVVLGHSLGDFAAAYTARVFSLEDGLRLVVKRGQLMERAIGTMVSVLASEEDVLPCIHTLDDVTIGVINGPQSVVLSGGSENMATVTEELKAAGFKTKVLDIPVAAHSSMLDSVLDTFEEAVRNITLSKPSIQVVSSMTGQLISDELTDPAYWRDHLRNTVRFGDGVTTLHEQGINIFLEMGPGTTLLGMTQSIYDLGFAIDEEASANEGALVNLKPPVPSGRVNPAMLPSLRQNQDDWQQMLTSLGELYVRGVGIDWASFDAPYPRQKVQLPTYPFQRERYWIETTAKRETATLTPLIDKLTHLPRQQEIVSETRMSVDFFPFLSDHQVFGEVVSPGAYQLAMALDVAQLAYPDHRLQLVDIVLPQALVLAKAEERTVQVVFEADWMPNTLAGGQTQAGQRCSFELISFNHQDPNSTLQTHASGHLALNSLDAIPVVELADLQARCPTVVDVNAFYANSAIQEIQFGPAFRWLAEVWAGEQEIIGRLVLPQVVGAMTGYTLYPALLDACFQLTGAQMDTDTESETRLPFAVDSLTVLGDIRGGEWWGHAQQIEEDKWHIQLLDGNGNVLVQVEGYTERAAPRHLVLGTEAWHEWLFDVRWVPQTLTDNVTNEEAVTIQIPEPVEGETPTKLWLLYAQPSNLITTELARQLQKQGQQVLFVVPGETYQLEEQVATINPTAMADTQQLLADLAHQGHSLGHVLYLWNEDDLLGQTISEASGDTTPTAVLQLCGGLLHLVQAMSHVELTPNLWLITSQSQAVDELVAPAIHVAQASLWGLARTIRAEHPEFNCRSLDLESLDLATTITDESDSLVAPLLAELFTAGSEPQIAYRQGIRYVQRLARSTIQKEAVETAKWSAKPYRVSLREYGSPDYLQTVPLKRREPQAHEVEIQIEASALNFRDVLNILGMFKTHRPLDLPLGFDCAGIVVAAGSDTGLALGDRVMAMGENTFASHMTVDARFVVKIPDEMTFENAAGIPAVFLTAYYGLVKLAKLNANDRVLIHAAAGGVGQAAIQIAQAISAEVYATASEGKWAFLQEQNIKHIYNSRTLAFKEEILKDTDGQGVDVVLNSLNGDFISHSVDVLAKDGRFFEMGKIDIWSHKTMNSYRSDVVYHISELDIDNTSDKFAEMFQEVGRLFVEGKLQPITQHIYPITETDQAVRFMQQAQHRGKIVLSMAVVKEAQEIEVHKEGSYLITGGLGGLGLQTAQSMAAAGGSHIILNSRRDTPSPEAQSIIDELRQQHVIVDVIAADVSDEIACQQLLDECQQKAALHQRTLKGIFHGAGVLDDGVLLQQNLERFATVMASKVWGGWHLHQQSQNLDLDFFVTFSSAASVYESGGQGNYAAANAFLDGLMHRRRAGGMKSLSINWGAWAEVGLATDISLDAEGISSIDPAQGGAVLIELLQRLGTQSQAQVVVQPTNWRKYLSKSKMRHPFYTNLVQELSTQRAITQPKPQVNLRQELASLSPQEQGKRLRLYLQETVRSVLGLSPQQTINPQHSVMNMGMDSLMAVEIRNRILHDLEIHISVTDLIDTSLTKLSTCISDELLLQIENEESCNSLPPTSIVAIQPHGKSSPLYCLPGAGGGILYMYKLAQAIGDHHPSYGLETVGFDGTRPPFKTVEDAATYQIAQLQNHLVEQVQISDESNNQFYLAGYSFGGLVAYEMTQQLVKAGGNVDGLFLLDTYLPIGKAVYEDEVDVILRYEKLFLNRLGLDPRLTKEQLAPLASEQRLLLFKQSLEVGGFQTNSVMEQIRGVVNTNAADMQAMAYLPTDVISVPIHLFLAMDDKRNDVVAKALIDSSSISSDEVTQAMIDGWSKYGKVTVHEVPGTHLSMLQEPYVKVLGEKIRACM